MESIFEKIHSSNAQHVVNKCFQRLNLPEKISVLYLHGSTSPFTKYYFNTLSDTDRSNALHFFINWKPTQWLPEWVRTKEDFKKFLECNMKLMKFIIKLGVNIESVNSSGDTPLLSLCKVLTRHVIPNGIEFLDYFLKNTNADILARTSLCSEYYGTRSFKWQSITEKSSTATCLMIACSRCDLELLKYKQV